MIIDCRSRVPYKDFLDSYVFNMGIKESWAAKFQMKVPNSVKQRSLELYFEELKQAGVNKVAARIRTFPGVGTDQPGMKNDTLVELVKEYPDTFIGIAELNTLNMESAKEEFQKYVLDGVCKGVMIEPGYRKIRLDDKSIFPIYESCEKNDIPLFVAYGGVCQKTMQLIDPKSVESVLNNFPKLELILDHGGWPYVQEMIWMCLCHENLHLIPDVYMINAPGFQSYIEAANSFITD